MCLPRSLSPVSFVLCCLFPRASCLDMPLLCFIVLYYNPHSIRAMCRYCILVFASDGVGEAEFTMFDKVGKAVVGKPLLNLLKFRNPGLPTIKEIARVSMVDRIAPPEVT